MSLFKTSAGAPAHLVGRGGGWRRKGTVWQGFDVRLQFPCAQPLTGLFVVRVRPQDYLVIHGYLVLVLLYSWFAEVIVILLSHSRCG